MDIRLPEDFPTSQRSHAASQCNENKRPLWKEDGGWLPDTIVDDALALVAFVVLCGAGLIVAWGLV